MKKEALIIIGTGQLSQDVRFFVERYDLYEVIGYAVNKEYIKSDTHEGLPVYPLETLNECVNPEEVKTFISISWFHYLNREREKAYNVLKEQGFTLANLISPSATVLTDKIGEGNWIRDFAYLDFGTSIGSNNVIGTYVFIAHYTSVGSHNFFGAKSLAAGNSIIGDSNFVGVASTIYNDISIGSKCIIGGNAAASKSMDDYTVCNISGESMIVKKFTKEIVEYLMRPGSEKRKWKK